MSRVDFHHKILRVVCRKIEFGHLVSAGISDMSQEEKQVVRDDLAQAGLPLSCMEDDEDLYRIARTIAARAVSLQ
jgi:hypothetical protein